MKESKADKNGRKIFKPSDFQINGNSPREIRIHNTTFYEIVLSGGYHVLEHRIHEFRQ